MSYIAAMQAAQNEYEAEQCRLAGLLQDAVDTGYNNVSSGTSSLDVQVCLPAGEPIPLSDETLKPAEEIEVDDIVFARPHDDPDGPKKICKVVAVYHNDPQPVLRLKLQNKTTGSIFERKCTKNHRIYVRDSGFVPAVDITEGSELLNANGESIVLLSKELEAEPVPVYNFQVEGAHTYFVGENDDESLLVHNEGCGGYIDPLDQLDSQIRQIRNPVVKTKMINTIAPAIAAIEGFEKGQVAGASEVTYKASLPIAWTCWKPEFSTLADIRDTAWEKSGLEGTATQTATQVSANVSVSVAYALLLRGPVIRAVGNKTVSHSEMSAILSNKPGFLQMSAYEKGIYLFETQGWRALTPTKEGIALGLTTKYPVWHYHAPSVETVVYGVPSSSATLYWIITGFNPSNNSANDNDQ